MTGTPMLDIKGLGKRFPAREGRELLGDLVAAFTAFLDVARITLSPA